MGEITKYDWMTIAGVVLVAIVVLADKLVPASVRFVDFDMLLKTVGAIGLILLVVAYVKENRHRRRR